MWFQFFAPLVADVQTLTQSREVAALQQQLHESQMQLHEQKAEARVLRAQLAQSEKLYKAAADGNEQRSRQADVERHHAQQLAQMQRLLQVRQGEDETERHTT